MIGDSFPVCHGALTAAVAHLYETFGGGFDALAPKVGFCHSKAMNERISIHPRVCHGQAQTS
jgi:hypothetical protein